MERPRRSPKRKTDPAFLYGKEKLTNGDSECKKDDRDEAKEMVKKKLSLSVQGMCAKKKDKLSRKKPEDQNNKVENGVQPATDKEEMRKGSSVPSSPPKSPTNELLEKLMESPETVHFNYQIHNEKGRIPCNATFFTNRLEKWMEVVNDFYCEQHKKGVHPQPPSKEKLMGYSVIRLTKETGLSALFFKFNDKNNTVVVTGANFQSWKDTDFHAILAKMDGTPPTESIGDKSEPKPIPSSSRGATPVPKRSRLSLKGAKEGKVVQKLAPLFNHPKEASTAPDMKCGLNGTVGSKTPTKHREKETVCVAALHNLGNTCFLNSILQILRHTPDFVDQLNVLAKEIKISEKERALVAELENNEEEEEVLTWKLVINIHELFRRMSAREEALLKGETKYIAIRPYDLLDTIERLNPMFQGNLQQDAHEFLRCILGYIQEAAKEVNRYRKSIRKAAYDQKPVCKCECETSPAECSYNAHDGTEACDRKPVGLSTDTKSPSVTCKEAADGATIKEEALLTDNEFDDDIRIEPIDFEAKYESDTKSIDSVDSVALLDVVPLEYLSPGKIKTSATVETSPVLPESVSVHDASTKFAVTAQDEAADGQNCKPTESPDCEVVSVDVSKQVVDVRGRKRLCRSRLTVAKGTDGENNGGASNGEEGGQIEASEPSAPVRKLSRSGNNISDDQADEKPQNSLLNFLKPLPSGTSERTENVPDAPVVGCADTNGHKDNGETSKFVNTQDIKSETSPSGNKTCDEQVSSQQGEAGGEDQTEKPKRGRKRKISAQIELSDKRRSSRSRGSRPPASQNAYSVSKNTSKATAKHYSYTDSEHPMAREMKSDQSSYPKITSLFQSGSNKRRLGVRGGLVVVSPTSTVSVKSESDMAKSCDNMCDVKLGPLALNHTTFSTPKQKNNAEVQPAAESKTPNTATTSEDSGTSALEAGGCQDGRVRPDSPETLRLKSEALEQGRRSVVKLKKLDKVEFTKYCGADIKPRSILEITRQTSDVVDCVEQLFQGTMAHRTKCLECEQHNERREEYQDISVPVVKKQPKKQQSEESDEEDNDDPTSWILNAMHEVERLRDDNKYRCDRCDHLVEAERSMLYPVIPTILTLHLKRFAALNGYFGGFTKNTDYVSTPTVLPPVQKEFDDNSRYELYGVVTHSGFSLSSGHYVAYVRAPLTHRSVPQPSSAASRSGPSQPQRSPPPEQASLPTAGPAYTPATPAVPAGGDTNNGNNGNNGEMADPNNNADTNNNLDASSPNRNLSPATDPSPGASPETSPEDPATDSASTNTLLNPDPQAQPSRSQHYWFECDDDAVSVLSPSDFEQTLSPNASGTPYMLFYCKVPNQSARC